MAQEIDFSKFLSKVCKQLELNVLEEMNDSAAQKIAKMGAVTVRREMRQAGVRRSTDTGTHLGRSEKQKASREIYGSVLDTVYKVHTDESSLNYTVKIHSGVSEGREHVGRFISEGTKVNRHNWGVDSGSPVAKNNYMKKARKIVDASAPSIIRKALRKSLNKQINVHGKKVLRNGKR